MTAKSVRQIRALLSVLAAHVGRSKVAFVLVLQLLAALSEGLGLALLVPAFSYAAGRSTVTVPGLGVTIPPVAALVAVVVAISARAALSAWSTVVSVRNRMLATDGLRRDVLDATLHANWRFTMTSSRSDLIQQLTSQIGRVGMALDTLARISVSVVMLCAISIAAIVVDPAIGLAALMAVALLALVARGTFGAAARLGRQLTQRVMKYGQQVTNTLATLQVARAHDAGARWLETVSAEAEHGRLLQVEFAKRQARSQFILTAAGAVGLVLLLVLARNAGVETAVLLALAVAASRLLSSTQMLIQMSQVFANAAAAVDDVLDYLREARSNRESEEAPGDVRPLGSAPAITLRDVRVGYDSTPVLDGFSCEIPAGGVTLILGPSGAGKSTLVALLLGLLTPENGEFDVDGVELTDIAAWRARCGYVPQETTLVTGSVRTNLTWTAHAEQDVDDAVLWEALRIAAVDDVVRALPDGLETDLTDFPRLSGGERQRLCIARALVRDPDVLVFDEATSALDEQTERRVLHGILERNRTVVMVSHRTKLSAFADQVVTVEPVAA